MDKEDRFIGFLDVLDIAGFVLATWRKLSVHLDERHFPAKEFFHTHIGDLVSMFTSFFCLYLFNLGHANQTYRLDFSHMNKPVLIDEDKSIADAINLFKSPSTYFRYLLNTYVFSFYRICLMNLIIYY